MFHLEQIVQIQQFTPFKFSEQIFSNFVRPKCEQVLPIVKSALGMVSSRIIDACGKKEAILASGAIGLSTLLFLRRRNSQTKSSKI
jgi:hypothetical protein